MTSAIEQGIRYAGEVEILFIEVYSHKKEKIDILPQMVEMSIFEDIFSNSIHGSLIVSDSYDLIFNFPFIGEELIKIKLRTPSMGDAGTVEYEGYIYKISDRHQTTERGQVYTIHFTSLETIIDVNKKVSKVFDGNVTDIVRSIVKDDDLLGSQKEFVAEKAGNNLKFVSPYWNPLKTINWLSMRALNRQNNSPTFVFYETLDNKFKFVSLDTLYSQTPKPGINYKYDSFLRETSATGSTKNIEREYNLIRDYYVDEVFDYITRSETGMYASKLINTNIVSKTIKTTSRDYLKDFANTNHLGKYPVASNGLLRRSGAAVFTVNNAEYVYDGQRDMRVEQWMTQRKSLIGQALNIFKMDIVVSGRLDVHAGDCVMAEINQLQPINRGDDKSQIVNGYFSGKFLIGAIHHRFEGNNHTMIMQCFTESLSKELQ